MKNLPDKIYLNLGDLSEEVLNDIDFHDLSEVTWSEDDVQGRNVEYVHKEAFIEKALKWYCLDCECNDNCGADFKCFFRQEYKRYLEGHDNAIPPKFDNAILPDEGAAKNYRYRHYIRKMQDAFIEKACEWLRTHSEADYFELIPDYNYYGAGNLNKKRMIEDFEKYIRGE